MNIKAKAGDKLIRQGSTVNFVIKGAQIITLLDPLLWKSKQCRTRSAFGWVTAGGNRVPL
jgi:hypothetical protein